MRHVLGELSRRGMHTKQSLVTEINNILKKHVLNKNSNNP